MTPNNSTDFSIPQRQSAAAIIILMAKSAVLIAKNVWPILLVTLLRVNRAGAVNKWLFIIIGFAVVSILFAIIRFIFYRFYIADNSLVIKTGWLKKKTLSIPIQSIQAVHLEQNLWQQVFRVYKVSFDSAGSEKEEATIDAISLEKAEQLKQILLSKKEAQQLEEVKEDRYPVYKLSGADLLKLSLSANHLEAFFILLALSINALDDLRKAFDFDGWVWMERVFGDMQEHVVLGTTIIIIFVALVSIGFSVISTFIKYFDFTLEDSGQNWKLSFGLFNRQQKIIPHNKIQLYGWHSNWIRRKINIWMLDIKTVGHEEVKRKQRLKIPLTSKQAAISLSNAYQCAAIFEPANGEMIEPDYWYRKTLLTSLPLTIILIGAGVYWLQWQAMWIGLIIFYFALRNYQWYKNYRWQANEEGLQLYSGLWGRRYQLLVWKKIQQVNFTQTPYQRSHQLASLHFTTAGGSVTLPYVSLSTAKALVNVVLYWVESKNEKWM